MSDYDTMMTGGAIVPETGAERISKAEVLDAEAERREDLAHRRAAGADIAVALKRTRELKTRLATTPSSTTVTVVQAGPPSLWELAKRPSPVFDIPWGVVVGGVLLGGFLILKRLQHGDD